MEVFMKNLVKVIARTWVILLVTGIMLGCVPPDQAVDPMQGQVPAGLAKAYDDAAWELLSENNGTFAYRFPQAVMPGIAIGDQVIHSGSELREVVAIVEKTDELLVVHTTVGNIARLFPSGSTLDVDSGTMTATVNYPSANTRGGSASYTIPLTLKQIREDNGDGSETVLYDGTGTRSIDLINVNTSASIIDIEKTYTQTIFDVSGKGEKEIGKGGKVEYDGNASLTIEEKVRLAVDFNIRLYMNYDCGINMVRRETVVSWYFFGWQETVIVWYEPVPWQSLKKDLKASIRGIASCGAKANLTCNGSVEASYEYPLPLNLSYSFLIGVVPIDIGYSAKLAASAKLEGSLNATTGASFSVNGEFGARCDDGGWSSINTFSTSSDFIRPNLTASASIAIVPKIENEIRLGIGFANTGVYGTVTLSPYLSFKAAAGVNAGTGTGFGSDRTWNVSCGVTGDVGVKASVVGYDLGSYNVQVLNYDYNIAGGTY